VIAIIQSYTLTIASAMGGQLKMRVSIFIDGNNFYHGLRSIYGKEVSLKELNYKNLISSLANEREVSEIFYYNAELDKSNNLKKFNSQKEFFDKLKKIPKLNLILCKLLKRRIKGTNKFYYVFKGDDIYLAVDLVSGAYENLYDTALIVSGDEDFVPAIRKVQKLGKKVENIYFCTTSSNYLKKTCNTSFCIDKKIAKSIELKEK